MKFKSINGFMICLVLFGNIATASQDNCVTIMIQKFLSMDGNAFYHHVTVLNPDIGKEFCRCDQESYCFRLREIGFRTYYQDQEKRREQVTQLLNTCSNNSF